MPFRARLSLHNNVHHCGNKYSQGVTFSAAASLVWTCVLFVDGRMEMTIMTVSLVFIFYTAPSTQCRVAGGRRRGDAGLQRAFMSTCWSKRAASEATAMFETNSKRHQCPQKHRSARPTVISLIVDYGSANYRFCFSVFHLSLYNNFCLFGAEMVYFQLIWIPEEHVCV